MNSAFSCKSTVTKFPPLPSQLFLCWLCTFSCCNICMSWNDPAEQKGTWVSIFFSRRLFKHGSNISVAESVICCYTSAGIHIAKCFTKQHNTKNLYSQDDLEVCYKTPEWPLNMLQRQEKLSLTRKKPSLTWFMLQINMTCFKKMKKNNSIPFFLFLIS